MSIETLTFTVVVVSLRSIKIHSLTIDRHLWVSDLAFKAGVHPLKSTILGSQRSMSPLPAFMSPWEEMVFLQFYTL